MYLYAVSNEDLLLNLAVSGSFIFGVIFTFQSGENHGKECHRFWSCLHHAMALISDVRIPASVKINWMAWTWTLTIVTAVFERIQEKLYGF